MTTKTRIVSKAIDIPERPFIDIGAIRITGNATGVKNCIVIFELSHNAGDIVWKADKAPGEVFDGLIESGVFAGCEVYHRPRGDHTKRTTKPESYIILKPDTPGTFYFPERESYPDRYKVDEHGDLQAYLV